MAQLNYYDPPKKTYFDNLANKLTSSHNLSSKDWWKTLKSFLSTQDKASPPPLKENDTIYTDDKEKANLLNSYFKTQSDLNDAGKELPHIIQSNPNNLTQLVTNPTEVKSILETLQTGKAFGPDNINNYVLKTCSSELSHPLSKLFNLSLSLSKAVYITPYSVKTSYKTSSVEVAKLKTSSISSSLVQGSLPSVKLC